MQSSPTGQKPAPKGLTIIGTHQNADFDALASLLAAQKLYPGSQVVFPGSQEKNLRNFFIDSMIYLFNMVDIKTIDTRVVTRLVLVDTRQPHRIGNLEKLLSRSNLEIHIYDHHPSDEDEVRADYLLSSKTGANVTILIEKIIEKGIEITPDEATVMCLGIYEDTGSFSFTSTTERDFQAAAFLLSKGANLNIISDLISREINPMQVALLHDMIQASSRLNINGIEIVITNVSTEEYIPDFAFLVHKMLRMENLDAIFAMARMGKKIYVVARSRVAEVDAGSILKEVGGGGHAYAAAATIKEKTLIQIEHKLIDILQKQVKSHRQAKHLMSAPPIAAKPEMTCEEAAKILTRYNINTLLIMEDPIAKENLLGFIARQTIEKALFHGLGHVAVREYMSTDFERVAPSADLLEIQETIIKNKQRILPVVDGGKVIGVLTRTDLLNILVLQNSKKSVKSRNLLLETVHGRTRQVLRFMNERLPEYILDILRSAGQTADNLGYEAYVIGGFVRDLFLYRRNEDVDIVIEGDGIAFAKEFARRNQARLHTHEKFGTAVITLPNGFKIDVASARLEYYTAPAALPTVEMSSIKLDLFRRDFTINTLAIHLSPKQFGLLIDFFGAQKDIKGKALRVLHSLSFVEDPTRVFRAIRFEQRFDFRIGKLTAGLIENAVKMDFFKRLSGKRVFTELRLILEEENPVPSIERLNDYDLLKTIHPGMALERELLATLLSVKEVLAWYDLLFLDESYIKWVVYFLAMTQKFDQETTEKICRRFELTPKFKTIFCGTRFKAIACLQWMEWERPIKNSDVYRKLLPFKTEFILYMMALTNIDHVKKSISVFITKLRHETPIINGARLKKMGYPSGPLFSKIFDALLDARLNGHVLTEEDEVNYIHEHFTITVC